MALYLSEYLINRNFLKYFDDPEKNWNFLYVNISNTKIKAIITLNSKNNFKISKLELKLKWLRKIARWPSTFFHNPPQKKKKKKKKKKHGDLDDARKITAV